MKQRNALTLSTRSFSIASFFLAALAVWSGCEVYAQQLQAIKEGYAQEKAKPKNYEVVVGKQYRLCNDMAKNFNIFSAEPPMVCERKFSPSFTQIHTPPWKELPADETLQAALALKKRLLEYAGWEDYNRKAEKADQLFREELARGKLKAWEAHFDIARSGSSVRVIKVTRNRCTDEKEIQTFEPAIGVFKEQKFELDPRYAMFESFVGDAIIYDGITYLNSWAIYPGAVGRSPGPEKRHRGYVFIWDTGWLKEGYGAGAGGTGVVGSVVCQIGYQRLK